MSADDDVAADELAVVYGWMQRMCSDRGVAEEWTIEAVRRFRRQEGPRWLQRRGALLRLRYLAVGVVIERRRTADLGWRPDGPTG